MSRSDLEPIAGFGGGFSGIENYYSAKIDAIEAQNGRDRDSRFADVLKSVASSEISGFKSLPVLPAADRSELKQPYGSISAQGAALKNLRS
jgi:hypothetical protein